MHKAENVPRTLAKHELPQLVLWLKSKFPKSLPVYHLIKNALREDWAWPGMDVMVDTFPRPAICICRTSPFKGKLVNVPMLNGHYIFVYANNQPSFLNLLRKNFDKLANWSETATFIDVDEDLGQILLDHNQQFARVTFGDNFGTGGNCFYFDLALWTDRRDTFPIPNHFRVGHLSVEHLDQIVANCAAGDAKAKKAFFTQLLTKGFPTAAIFDTNHAQSSAPVVYCMYMPQGSISAVYLHPDYREQGLFKMVTAELINTLYNIGEVSVWMESVNVNFPTQLEDLHSLGGRDYERHRKCWIQYVPKISKKVIPEKTLPQKAQIGESPVPEDDTLSDMESDEEDFYAERGSSKKYGHSISERQRQAAKSHWY
ncbi:uncharacterized protein LOC129592664 [Paramacrobiotus metropolitanus]|uniref:uncharacterized protein LOC129592664 n=1 Tax=Paramacrobiotus metropolitanus TaxID=2943436 RepID=UPI002445B804|nr:uncharacterized protein LOC129592664 [Paramacrobiotus metropolitanus]